MSSELEAAARLRRVESGDDYCLVYLGKPRRLSSWEEEDAVKMAIADDQATVSGAALAMGLFRGEPAIDYKLLLQKYMQHVLDNEGTTFVQCATHTSDGPVMLPGFSREESIALREIDGEVS